MPVSEVLRLGPFSGGINLASDPTSVADTELVRCDNLELDIDGSLRSRPPYVVTGGEPGLNLPGDGSYAETTTSPVSTSLEFGAIFEAEFRVDDFSTDSHQSVLANYNTFADQRSILFRATDQGELHVIWSSDGVGFQNVVSSTEGTYCPEGERVDIQITIVVQTDGDYTVNFQKRLTPGGIYETQHIATGTTTHLTLFDSNQNWLAGAWGTGSDSLNGVIYRVQWGGAVGGPIVDADFEAQAPGSTGFVDDAGVTWNTVNNAGIGDDNTFDGNSIVMIGSGIFDGVGYIIGSAHGSSPGLYFSTDGVAWTAITLATDRVANVAVQYADKMWVVMDPSSPGDGIQWDPVAGATAVAAMPRGVAAVVHKERLYICSGPDATNPSRVHFSDPADFTTWPGTNFLDVSPGDGSSARDILVYQDNLMIFKDDSTFILAYDLSPTEAILREINPVVGVNNHRCAVQFENIVYVLHNEILYEVINYDFNPLNIKVPFVIDKNTIPGIVGIGPRNFDTCISLMGERIVVRIWNNTYIFGLRTKTWSQWRNDQLGSFHNHGPYVALPVPNGEDDLYFAGYGFDKGGYVISQRNGYDSVRQEGMPILCQIQTKDFDMADPVHFKRLFYWSGDILSGGEIRGTVSPIAATGAATWGSLATFSWDSPSVFTWNSPLGAVQQEMTTVPGDGNWGISKAVKFNKALRFRKINFYLETETVGLSTAGPVKIFSLIAFILNKATVTAQVS